VKEVLMNRSRLLSVILLLLTGLSLMAQSSLMQKQISLLTPGPVPGDLLSTKTIALYDPTFTAEELEQIQNGFDKTGVDAVLYCPVDLPMCNRDVQKVFTDYLIKREIKYILFLQKNSPEMEFIFTEFTKTKELIKPGQLAWKMTGKSINEISLDIYRTALNNQKRVNMLVAPLPEFELKLSFIKGMRAEYFPADLKVDKLAIIKFGDEQMDQTLEEIFKTHYPFAYQFFEPGSEETAIRQKGFLFSLAFINTRGYPAMELLEYNMAKAGSAITSASYPNGQLQLKTYPAEMLIYKFYFKHLENQNIYLGTKWDADPDWQQALINQIKGLKAELRVN
jgi:hypothetical protein